MKKKMKKYEGGGDVYTGDDEIVKYRMGMTDKKEEPKAEAPSYKDESMGEFTTNIKDEAPKAIPKKAAAKLTPKAEAPTPKEEPKAEPKAEKANPVQQAKDVIKGKDVTAPKLYDPLAKYEQTGPKRPEATPKPAPKPAPVAKASSEKTGFELKKEKAIGMKAGGKVKSASARADGCCIRGKTRA